MKKHLSGRPIRIQIMTSMIAVSILVMVILGSVIYDISRRVIEENYQTTHRFNMELTDELITLQLGQAVDEARNLLNDDDFVDVLKGETGSSAYFSSAGQVRLRRLLSAALDTDIIQEIVVISNGGNVYYTTKYANTLQYFSHYYTDGSILAENWVFQADAARGKEVFFGCNLVLKDSKPNSFSMAKKLVEPFTGESLGYLIVNFRSALISYIFNKKSADASASSFMILDAAAGKYEEDDGEYVVCYKGDDADRERILSDYREGITDRYLFTGYTNDLTGWDIIGIVKKSDLQKDSNYIGLITWLAGLALAALQAVVAVLISRRISRPLSVLERTMQEVADGRRNVTAEFDDSEVGRIGNRFKYLVNNNLELREQAQQMELKEKEAELLLLQSQINPHFLYNTLDNIYMMALVKGEDEIADSVQSLSELFRLSLNAGKKLILVEDELRHIAMYMKIQSSRFKDRYALTVDVEERIRRQRILVFILQPLVENAVLHGLEPKIGKGSITVKGRMLGGVMGFSVEDDGVGIRDMEDLGKGYGIRNIRERLRIFYGEGNYELGFESGEKGGTRVLLRLPVLKEGEEHVQGSGD